MQLSRARFLSSERRMCQGACFGVRRLEHHVAGARILEPLAARRQIHGAEFPLPQRIVDARLETPLLLLVADFQPDLDELDAAIDDVFLDLGAEFEEACVLFLRAEAHDVFDAGAVVPTAVEDHDLARRRKVLHVTLHVHLRLLAVGRRGQRDDAEHARADPLGDGADGAALARGVAAFEDDDDAQPLVLDPLLEIAQARPGACAVPSRIPWFSFSQDRLVLISCS